MWHYQSRFYFLYLPLTLTVTCEQAPYRPTPLLTEWAKMTKPILLRKELNKKGFIKYLVLLKIGDYSIPAY